MNGFLITIAVIVIVCFFLFKKKGNARQHKEKQDIDLNQLIMQTVNNIGANSKGQYWEGFKRRNPMDAQGIENITHRDMKEISDKDAFQIVTSLLRWSKNSERPVNKLKASFYDDIDAQGIPEEIFLKKLKQERLKEAKQLNICPDNTVCNFMYKIILERQEKQEKKKYSQNSSKQLKLSDDAIESFEESIAEKEQELNIAPDISKLDREENKLFNLANEGIDILDNLLTMSNDFEKISFNKRSRIEARILCSTMVMDLHSNFKNEIDLDNQADRYFLLLADQTTFDDVDSEIKDEIAFINSRIAFYKEELQKYSEMSSLQVFMINNAIGHIFNALYVKPLSDNPKEIEEGSISTSNLIMFKKMLDDTCSAMTREKNQILGKIPEIEKRIYELSSNIFAGIIPPTKKEMITEDMAWIFTDQILTIVQSQDFDSSILNQLPHKIVNEIANLRLKCQQSNLSDNVIKSILGDAQHKFIKHRFFYTKAK